MAENCPERDAGQSHDYDGGECAYCGAPQPESAPEPTTAYDDSWVTLALEDAYSMGGDA